MKLVSPLSLVLLALMLSCVPKSKDDRKDGRTESSSPEAAEEADPEVDEVGATDPVSIAGVNLIARYDNTRARCDFKNTAADDYEIYCRVTIVSEFETEFLPLRVSDDIKLSWQTPIQSRGNFILDMCQESTDALSFHCRGQLKSGISSLQFPLIIREKASERLRTETSDVLLPYFVGVIEGDFSDTHRFYTKIPEPQFDRLVQGDRSVAAGFYRSKIDRTDHKLNVLDACDHDQLVVMATPSYVYLYDSRTDSIKPIAGRFDENTLFSYSYEDPTRLNHQTYRVVCGKNGFTSFHASSGWDIDSNGMFSSALRSLHFDYSGKLLNAKDSLTDQSSGRVAQVKTNRNLSDPGVNRQRIATLSSFDGDRFVLIDVVKSASKLEWISRLYLPEQVDIPSSKILQSIDISAGDPITPALVEPDTLVRFVRDSTEVLLYSGYCHYMVYDLEQGRIVRELGPKKSVLTSPNSCGDDTVIVGREFSSFAADSFIYKIDNSTYRTVDAQQSIKNYSSGSFAWTTPPADLLKQGMVLPFENRFPANSKSYPLKQGRMLLTNMEYLALVQDQKLNLISANSRLRLGEIGRIDNIFYEPSTQKTLRIYNRTTADGSLAVVEELRAEKFMPLFEVPCSVITLTGTCAELIFKTGPQAVSFLVSTPGANASVPDRTDRVTFDTSTRLVTVNGSFSTPRSYRYRNTRSETLSSRVILRHESQSTFMLFDATNGLVTAINLGGTYFMDSNAQYSINEAAGTLDLLVAQAFESAPSKQYAVFHQALGSTVAAASALGLVGVPAAASGNAALSYTAAEDGKATSMNIGFQANAKAFDQKSNLYFYFSSGVYVVPAGASKMTKLLDLESSRDCGGKVFQGESRESEISSAIKTSMKSLCYNKTDGMFVTNGCEGKQGFINFFIRQYFGNDSANLTLITAPCSLLP